MKISQKISILLLILFNIAFTAGSLNARDIIVNPAHEKSDDGNTATEESPLKTISKAAQIAVAGDKVIVYGGTYREWVKPANSGRPDKPIVYCAAKGERVVIKGSDVYKGPWKSEGENIFSTEAVVNFTGQYNPFNIKRSSKAPDYAEWTTQYNLGQIFVDGVLYTQTIRETHLKSLSKSWLYKDGKIFVHFDMEKKPESCLVEISVRPRVFAPIKRGLGYITVKGFVIEHAANQYPKHFWDEPDNAQAGALGCGSGHHWLIEDNTVRYANTIGIDCGSETSVDKYGNEKPDNRKVGYHTIKNNLIEYNGCTGIAGWEHRGTVVTGNVIRNNNTLGIMSWETAGIKFHFFYGGVIKDNYIYDNDAWGIWLDNVFTGSRVESNLIVNNLWGGIFLEKGNGPSFLEEENFLLVANNVIANSASGNDYHRGGNGIYAHDVSGVKVYHNLFYANAGYGITSRITSERTLAGELVQASKWDIRNNIFSSNKMGNIALTVPFERAHSNTSDYNVFLEGWPYESPCTFTYNFVTTRETRMNTEYIKDYLKQEIVRKGLRSEQRPVLESWDYSPEFSIGQWRAISDNDLHSKVLSDRRKEYITLRRAVPDIHFSDSSEIFDLRFPALEDVNKDYFNRDIKSAVRPGPFQSESEDGVYLFYLWPKCELQ